MHLNLVKISKFIYSYRLIFLYILLVYKQYIKETNYFIYRYKNNYYNNNNNEKQQQRWNYLKFRLNCL